MGIKCNVILENPSQVLFSWIRLIHMHCTCEVIESRLINFEF